MKVRSLRGVEVNMSVLMANNETTVALGNARMNTRGDILGARGQIIKTRDEIAQEYHRSNPKAVRSVALKDISSEIMTPTAPVATPVEETTARGSDKLSMDFADPAAALEAVTVKKKTTRKIEDSDQ